MGTAVLALELRPYSSKFPYLQYILQMSNLYRSHHNAVQASLTQRTSHGLSFTAAYTYSHATDDVSQNFWSTTPLNNTNPNTNYGNSDYDIRQRFTFEASYALPGKKSPGQIPGRLADKFHRNIADWNTPGPSRILRMTSVEPVRSTTPTHGVKPGTLSVIRRISPRLQTDFLFSRAVTLLPLLPSMRTVTPRPRLRGRLRLPPYFPLAATSQANRY